jgi:hypothetical protein
VFVACVCHPHQSHVSVCRSRARRRAASASTPGARLPHRLRCPRDL